jgi:putative toxin-antitoxin system antitoxin component (TIGR02293 family)
MTAAISPFVFSAEAMLGGELVFEQRPRTALDWISVIRQGIPSSAVDSIARTIRVSKSELAAALAIPERTLARRKKEGLLNSEESAKLIRLARVVERAEEVFENMPAAIDWLKSPNAALSGATPLSLIDTEIGAQSVMDTLGRIAHGVFA